MADKDNDISEIIKPDQGFISHVFNFDNKFGLIKYKILKNKAWATIIVETILIMIFFIKKVLKFNERLIKNNK